MNLFLLSTGRAHSLTHLEINSLFSRHGLLVNRWMPLSKCLILLEAISSDTLLTLDLEELLKKALSSCSLIRLAFRFPPRAYGKGSDHLGKEIEGLGLPVVVADVVITGRKLSASKKDLLKRSLHISAFSSSSDLFVIGDFGGCSQQEEKGQPLYLLQLFAAGADKLLEQLDKQVLKPKTSRRCDSQSVGFTTSLDGCRSLLAVQAAHVSVGDIVLDPFGGSGALLLTASLLGASVLLHSDILPSSTSKPQFVKTTKSVFDRVCADARHSPWRGHIDAILCDLPYEKRTALLDTGERRSDSSPNDLVSCLLLLSASLLTGDGRCVFWWFEDDPSGGYNSAGGAVSEAVVGESTRHLLAETLSALGISELEIIDVAGDDFRLGRSAKEANDSADIITSTARAEKETASDEKASSSWNRVLVVLKKKAGVTPVAVGPSSGKYCDPYLQFRTKSVEPGEKSDSKQLLIEKVFTAARRGDVSTMDQVQQDGVLAGIIDMPISSEINSLPQKRQRGAYCLLSVVRDENGNTPLICCAGYGKLEAVKWLLERGVDVDALGKKGETALMRAARFGHDVITHALLKESANPHILSEEGWTAAAYAIAFDHCDAFHYFPWVSIFSAPMPFDGPVTQAEGTRPPVVEPKDYGKGCPLHICARWGAQSVIYRLRLIFHQVETGVVTDTPLPWTWKEYVNRPLSDGTRALHLAARYDHLDTVAYLLKHSADPNLRDNCGNTALDIARKWDRIDVADYLEDIAPSVEAN